jgi:hypothetical protein
MCGIIGVLSASGADPLKRRQYVEQALLVGTLRGKDGTGVYMVPRSAPTTPRAHWAKMASCGSTFLKEAVAKDALNRVAGSSIVIGHNRSATVGGASTKNTHPFTEGPITLVHNGTIHNQEALTSTETDVDSHAIAHALVEKPVNEIIEGINGAFALCWYDARDGYLNIIRNMQRPLHFGISFSTDSVYIASEAKMLEWLTDRLNITISKIVQPDPGVLLRWHYTMDSLYPEVSKLDVSASYSKAASGYGYWMGYNGAANSRTWPMPGSSPPAQSATEDVASTQPDVVRKTSGTYVHKAVAVPPTMVEQLEDEALSPEDRMLFTPQKVERVTNRGRTLARIVGVVGCAEVPAVVYNVSYKALGSKKYAAGDVIEGPPKFWVISPIGVRSLHKYETEVIGRVVEFDANPVEFVPEYLYEQDAYFLYEGVDAPDADDTSAAEALVSAAAEPTQLTYPGPHGAKVSRERWLNLTMDGCYECGDMIKPSDAFSVSWMSAQQCQVPVCSSCKARLDKDAKAAVRV